MRAMGSTSGLTPRSSQPKRLTDNTNVIGCLGDAWNP